MKNLLHIKTTIVGIFIMYFSYKYLGSEDTDRITFFVLFGVGIGLLFLPDTFIESIKRALKLASDKFLKK